MDALLEGVAARNGGYFTRAEALDHGYSDRELAAACRSGVLRHIRHGAYAPAELYDSCDEVGRRSWPERRSPASAEPWLSPGYRPPPPTGFGCTATI
jgi:hypothetical protein